MRTVDPTQVRLRHISRCGPSDDGATTVGAVHFRANDLAGVNGRVGWVSGEITEKLSDDGTATIRLPNSAGADGTLHRRRFAVITDSRYRMGEEWIEIWREGHHLEMVVTPVSYTISRTEITLECVDPLALTTLVREEASHAWCASPRDAIDFYSRLEQALGIWDLRATDMTGTGTTDGWTHAGVAGSGAGVSIGAFPASYIHREVTRPSSEHLAYTFSVIGTLESGQVRVKLADTSAIAGTSGMGHIDLDPSSGTATFADGREVKMTELAPGAPLDVRFHCRGRWLWTTVLGRVIDVRQVEWLDPGDTYVVISGTCTVAQVAITEVRPFLAEPGEGDRHLPGAPTPGGLWAEYFAEPDAKSRSAGDAGDFERLCLSPLNNPVTERLDPIAHPAADPPAFQPAAIGETWWSARFTGAIYLDLAASDRTLRTVAGAATRVRLWVGKTDLILPGGLLAGSGTQTSTSLRAHLGEKAGWYPIVIEINHRDGEGGVALLDRGESGDYAQVPTDRLSPYGVFSDVVQRESHRQMVSQLTEAFGYQWLISPRSLESGEFPGRLIPRVREGRDTNITLTDDDAMTPSASGSVADSCDRIVLEAAGLPTVDGAAAKSIEVLNPAGGDHLYLSTAYDQASEISDELMLRQRADSMLALRAGPWEQLKLDAAGANELVDSWPLTGEAALMRWKPGDGVRLAVTDVGQVDLLPRQLTGVTRKIYPDGVSGPQITWRQRPRGARSILERALRASFAARRTYQGQLATIDGSAGANPAPGSPTTMSLLMLPAGSRVARLELRIAYLSGNGSAAIEVNEHEIGQSVSGESPIDLTAHAAPITATDQRIGVRLVSVSDLLVEIQVSAVVVL